MQLLSKFNKGIRFLLCVIDLYSKCAWVVLLKDKKDVIIVNTLKFFQIIQWENQVKYELIKEVNFRIG